MAQYPHVEWLDLNNDGNLHEVAVVKRDRLGNVYFLQLRELDVIDRRRLAGILTNRNAPNMELFELFSQITLGNGMNALEYFHQLVRIKTAAGPIVQSGRAGQRMIQVNAPQAAAQPARRGPGRPPAAAKNEG